MNSSLNTLAHMLGLLLAVPLWSCGDAADSELTEAQAKLSPPSWIGNASYAITRCSAAACAGDIHPLTETFFYDDWAVTRAAVAELFFEVWEPHVTDWDNPGLWQALDARVHFRVAGREALSEATTSPDAFDWRWVNVAARVGNNARYAAPLRQFDPFVDATTGRRTRIETPADCPHFPVRPGRSPQSVEADVEIYIGVNGVELRPSAGAVFRGTYATYARDSTLCAPRPAIVDQVGGDVAVLQGWLGERLAASTESPSLGGTRFDPALCVGQDCTRAAQAVLRLPGAPEVSPFISTFSYSAGNSGLCEVIELRTVTRQLALDAPSFVGLGFWFAGVFGLIPKNSLHSIGQVTLADGAPATVHRFLAQGSCFGLGGSNASMDYRHYEFKPFARFDAGSPSIQYRVWDLARDDYRLGRSADGHGVISGFDREYELLAH